MNLSPGKTTLTKAVVAGMLISMVSGCGGGGDSSSPTPTPPSPPPTSTPTPTADTTPDVFSFGDSPDAFTSELVASGAVTVLSIDDGASVSVNGGEFSIDGGAFLSDSATINAGQKVQVRVMSSADSLGESTATLTVGDFSTDFTVITNDIAGRTEAESAINADGLTTSSIANSSGGEVVSLTDSSDVVSLIAPREGKLISIRYRSDNEENLNIIVNGSTVGTVTLLQTNDLFQTAELFVPIAEGSTIDIALNSAAQGAVTLDYIDVMDDLSATTIARNMGYGFNLGQMFESDQHAPTLENAKPKIDAYYAAGFRNIRIPVTWTEDIDGSSLADKTTGVIDMTHPRLAELIKVVEYALSLKGMHVVVNMHHESTLKAEDNFAVLENVWDGISSIFVNHSHRLLFEVLNEPHQGPNDEPMAAASVRRMTGLAYDKIRALNPERIIIIGGDQWFGAAEMARTWPDLSLVGKGNDAYIMSTFHHYSPWEFNGEANKTYLWDESTITSDMATQEDWVTSIGNDMPVYIGEWGNSWNQYLQTANCNNIRSWYDNFADNYADARAIETPTAVWDDGGWFMIWDHNTNDWNNSLYQCITGTCMPESFERLNAACTDTN
ncbi:MAG: cellulase family glycosylhydrolase [Alteromonadaceae bacterium]|nr:cellulase family glycosylhydrolase [Alteromonadaceae bacterium]